jgi:hypothetical protein
MRYRIPVYKAEREVGLSEVIQANASVAYYVPLEPLVVDSHLGEYLHQAFAAEQKEKEDQFDLYYMKDILATTGWNKNKDIFLREETWAARHTPEDKPFNFEHRPLEIIGHITASRVVDDAMNDVADDSTIEDLPDKFHVISGSVLYMALADDDRRSLMQQTVAEIERGEWYVSMECFLRGFDYGVIGPDGTQRVIARNEQTAFLTKYMRQYPPAKGTVSPNPYYGSGTYLDEKTGQEYEIGRVMRNITFSGKGLVRKPGNPESIIFSSVASFVPTEADSVYLTAGTDTTPTIPTEEETMADTPVVDQVTRDQLAEARRANDELQREIASLKSKNTDETITALRKDIADRDAVIASKDAEISSLTSQVTAITESSKALETRATTAEEALKTATDELGVVKAAEVKRARLSLLKEKGADDAAAAKLVETLAGLGDEAFASTVDTVSAQWKKVETPAPKAKTDPVVDGINKAKADAEPALVTASDNDEPEKAQAACVDYLGTFLRSARTGRPSAFATDDK